MQRGSSCDDGDAGRRSLREVTAEVEKLPASWSSRLLVQQGLPRHPVVMWCCVRLSSSRARPLRPARLPHLVDGNTTNAADAESDDREPNVVRREADVRAPSERGDVLFGDIREC